MEAKDVWKFLWNAPNLEDFLVENLSTLKFSWRIHYRSFRPKKSISSLKLTANGTLKMGLTPQKERIIVQPLISRGELF